MAEYESPIVESDRRIPAGPRCRPRGACLVNTIEQWLVIERAPLGPLHSAYIHG